MNTETLTLAKRELEHMGYSDIIISHDERYFGVADRVLRLEDGKLAGIDQ